MVLLDRGLRKKTMGFGITQNGSTSKKILLERFCIEFKNFFDQTENKFYQNLNLQYLIYRGFQNNNLAAGFV